MHLYILRHTRKQIKHIDWLDRNSENWFDDEQFFVNKWETLVPMRRWQKLLRRNEIWRLTKDLHEAKEQFQYSQIDSLGDQIRRAWQNKYPGKAT